ncbi:MAG: hypothetical protein IMZ57_01015 [Acidobacteria bacterium]|nr:hypothetical protein [Acidobacteriota bacterium]
MLKNILKPQLEFDPKKPFYPLVAAYLCQVHGLVDLASRGICQLFDHLDKKYAKSRLTREQKISILLKNINAGYRRAIERAISHEKPIMIFKPELLSSCGKSIGVDSEALADNVFNEPDVALEYFNRISAGGLLILAWTITGKKHNRDPLWQFLRHCRNAAAHNGAFHFDPGEPKKPAEWRTLKIVRAMQGDCLFTDPPKKGFIGIGDVLYLLADIEKKFY